MREPQSLVSPVLTCRHRGAGGRHCWVGSRCPFTHRITTLTHASRKSLSGLSPSPQACNFKKILERTYWNSVLLYGTLVLNMAFTHGFSLGRRTSADGTYCPALPTPGDRATLWANWTLCLHRPLLVQMLGRAGQGTSKPKHITARPDAQVRSPRTRAGRGQRCFLATWQEPDFEGIVAIYLDFGPSDGILAGSRHQSLRALNSCPPSLEPGT